MMVLKNRHFIAWVAIFSLLLAACGPQPTVIPGSGNGAVNTPAPSPVVSPTPLPPADTSPAAVSGAQAWLAAQLGVPVAQISVKDVKQTDWPDGCLGLPKSDELCAMHVVPGWLVSLVANNRTYEVRTDMNGTIVRANLAQSVLAGTKWTLVSFGLPGAETLVIAGSNLNLAFDSAGQASGSTGCNSYNSKVDVQGDTLAFNAIISTKRACVDANLNQQEARFVNALQHAGQFTLSGDRLTIFSDGGSSALNFVKA